MTEAEWLNAADPTLMLTAVESVASERRWRLFASACCRRVWHLVDANCQHLGEVLERFADGQNSESEVHAAYQAAYDPGAQTPAMAFQSMAGCELVNGLAYAARCVADNASSGAADVAADFPDDPEHIPLWVQTLRDEHSEQCHLLRDIFGNPFRSVTVDSRWWSEAAVTLATSIYAERAFDRLPILADSLEEAGCDHADILAHCRGDGPHVRGCWVVDLVLGKS